MQPLTRFRNHRNHRMPPWQAWLYGAMWGMVLLAAQCLSLAHRVDHAPGLATGMQAEQWDGHAPGGASCQLLDHLGLADALPGLVFSLPALPCADGMPAAALRSVGYRPAPSAFLARAPPRA